MEHNMKQRAGSFPRGIRDVAQLAVGIGVAFALSACSTWEKLDSTERGAAIGVGSGAVVGGAVGGTTGAVVGGLGGGVAGGLIGREIDEDDERDRRRRARDF